MAWDEKKARNNTQMNEQVRKRQYGNKKGYNKNYCHLSCM